MSAGSSSTNKPDRGDAGVVDQGVQRAEAVFGRGEEGFETVGVPDVQRQADRAVTEFGGDGRAGGGVDVADDHRHARAQAGLGGGATDAARTSGDRDALDGHDGSPSCGWWGRGSG